MVSLLTLGVILKYNVTSAVSTTGAKVVGLIVVLVCAVAIGWAVRRSKMESPELEAMTATAGDEG